MVGSGAGECILMGMVQGSTLHCIMLYAVCYTLEHYNNPNIILDGSAIVPKNNSIKLN